MPVNQLGVMLEERVCNSIKDLPVRVVDDVRNHSRAFAVKRIGEGGKLLSQDGQILRLKSGSRARKLVKEPRKDVVIEPAEFHRIIGTHLERELIQAEPAGQEISERTGAERIDVARGEPKKLGVQLAPKTVQRYLPEVRIINGFSGEVRAVGGGPPHVGRRPESLKPQRAAFIGEPFFRGVAVFRPQSRNLFGCDFPRTTTRDKEPGGQCSTFKCRS